MATYSEGSVRKLQLENGSWEWQGRFSARIDGKQKHFARRLGVECDPLTKEEKEAGRKFVPTGKGAKTALDAFKEWRKETIKELEGAEERAALPSPAKMETPDYVAYYLSNKRDHEQSTAANMAYVARHIESPCLRVPMCDLTTDNVEAWLKELEEGGLGSSMRAKAFGLLKAACKYAVKARHIRHDPTEPIDAPKADKHKPNPLDDFNLAYLNAALDSLDESDPSKWRITNAARIALLTGMRAGEVCGLRWKDVSGWKTGKFEGEAIRISNVIARGKGGNYNKPYPKNRRERTVPISGQLAEVLTVCRLRVAEDCIQEAVPFTGELYVLGKAVRQDETGTGYLSPMFLSKQWTMLVSLTPVKGLEGGKPVFHDLRHTFATHAIASGLDAVTVAHIMGHSNPSITLSIYADYLPTKGREAMEQMGELLSKRKKPTKVVELPTGTDD